MTLDKPLRKTYAELAAGQSCKQRRSVQTKRKLRFLSHDTLMYREPSCTVEGG